MFEKLIFKLIIIISVKFIQGPGKKMSTHYLWLLAFLDDRNIHAVKF